MIISMYQKQVGGLREKEKYEYEQLGMRRSHRSVGVVQDNAVRLCGAVAWQGARGRHSKSELSLIRER